MRKVMVFIPELKIGGAQKMVIEIIRCVRKMDPNIQFRILVLGRCLGTFLEQTVNNEKIDVVYLGKEDGIHPQYILKIYRAIKAFDPDIIHAHLSKMHYLLLPMVLCKVPVRYYTVHSLADRDTPYKILRKIMGFSFRHCHVHPVAISEMCQRSIAWEYHLPVRNIIMIYNGIDIKYFARKTPYSDLDNLKINFIAVGRLSKEKNYPMMLSAFKMVYQRNINVHLTILGAGELWQELNDICSVMGLENAVTFKGSVENVKDYLCKAHVFLMSSDYEGLPVSILEAMAAGLPIISTRAGGVTDVVEQEGNGLLVDIGDKASLVSAMIRLAEDGKLRKAFSTRSEQLSKQYSIEACAEKYLELYLK